MGKELNKYETLGREIGKFTDEKNLAYGNSFQKSQEFMLLLFPNGVPVEKYTYVLLIIRMFDKFMRIATSEKAFSEDPWQDLAGYSLLGAEIARELENEKNSL